MPKLLQQKGNTLRKRRWWKRNVWIVWLRVRA